MIMAIRWETNKEKRKRMKEEMKKGNWDLDKVSEEIKAKREDEEFKKVLKNEE